MANDQYQIKQLDSYSVFLPPAGYSATPEALEVIVPELLRRGYEFVTVSNLLGF